MLQLNPAVYLEPLGHACKILHRHQCGHWSLIRVTYCIAAMAGSVAEVGMERLARIRCYYFGTGMVQGPVLSI